MSNFNLKRNNKVRFFITVFLSLLGTTLLTISVGFSALNKDLSIAGDIDYEKYSPTLYNVLKKEADIGTYAKQFTDNHQDSFIAEPTQNIYHWYASNDSNANTILDKWNVIFGEFCWQMIRTTDTGGVKLIYNGIPNEGKCNNEGTAQQIGRTQFNANSASLADASYMNNIRYIENTIKPDSNKLFDTIYMAGSFNYYYGTGVIYDSDTKKYILTDITQDTWTNTYSSSGNLYTCRSTTETTCSTVYYIAGGRSDRIYGFSMTEGNLLNYYNTNILLGTDYTEDNGIYTLTDSITISKLDWFSNYSPYKNYYTCGSDSITCTDLKYITSTGSYYYYSLFLSNNYKYAKDFVYNSATGIYTLGSDRYETWNMTDNDKSNLNTHHYTCFNNTGECETLSYVYFAETPSISSYIYYIDLTNGNSIEDAIDEMLYSDNVNQTNSTIKTYIDDWYESNMTNYTTYLEDTIFCYNRIQINSSTNGWNPNGGSVSKYLEFVSLSLTCEKDTDKFSLSNNKARLDYPVGLATYKELALLNHTVKLTRKTGASYWIGSFSMYHNSHSYGCTIDTLGGFSCLSISATSGVRPSISLKPGTEYVSGTGSKDDPYVVE
ncbi:MAG: hypothetical protein IJL76_02720 [Bacilli bacterium]|nr:hypothetical protein [Bacilli bacterium]